MRSSSDEMRFVSLTDGTLVSDQDFRLGNSTFATASSEQERLIILADQPDCVLAIPVAPDRSAPGHDVPPGQTSSAIGRTSATQTWIAEQQDPRLLREAFLLPDAHSQLTGWWRVFLAGIALLLPSWFVVRHAIRRQHRDRNTLKRGGDVQHELLDETKHLPTAQQVATRTHPVIRAEESLRLSAAIAKLPDDQRHVITRHQFDEADYETIAVELNRSTEATRMIKVRALRSLRILLKDEGNTAVLSPNGNSIFFLATLALPLRRCH